MSVHVLAVAALVAIFAVGVLRDVNIGPLAFAAALLVGTIGGGLSGDKIVDQFPVSLFLILVGVTYLFGIAQATGAIGWLVNRAVWLVGGRVVLLPWMLFVVSGLLTAVGAPTPAAAAIIAPVAIGLATTYRLNTLVVGALVVHGTMAGGFSPISVFGVITADVLTKARLPIHPVGLFLASLVVNLIFAAVAYVVLTARDRRRNASSEVPADVVSAKASVSGTTDRPRLRWPAALSLAGIAAMVVLALAPGLDLDLGLVALAVAAVLALVDPGSAKRAVSSVAWSTVLLVTGVVTYAGVLQEIGTIDAVSAGVMSLGAPLLAALLLCYIAAVVSAFASTTGLLGALIPLAVPLLAVDAVGAFGMVAALGISASIVDISPFSTSGALVLANVRETERADFYRRLLRYGAVMVAAAPVVVWLALVVPGW